MFIGLNNTIDKIKILNELTNPADGISNLIEKYNTLAIEYENIVNNQLSDIDYCIAFKRLL